MEYSGKYNHCVVITAFHLMIVLQYTVKRLRTDITD